MSEYKRHIIRIFLIHAFILTEGIIAFSQTATLRGIVKDNYSLTPISNVNIKINGTKEGVFTGPDGRFSLTLKRTPVSLTISCVGYEPLYYNIDKIPVKPITLILRQRTSDLQEVDIKAMRFNYIFKDLNFSVLDYEIMNDNLLLLVFRYQLRNTELILLNRDGDTLCVVPVPEQKPMRLYRDFLGNIHYISTKENAFQCEYNDVLKKMEFPYRTTYDTLVRKVKPFLFTAGDRLYFEEFTPDGFGKNIGYYDTIHGKEYIRNISGETTQRNYFNDLKFNAHWNSIVGRPARFTEDDYRADKHFYYQKINAPLVKLGDNTMADFNFTDGVIEFMNREGMVYRKVPIDFQEETNGNLLAGLLSVFIPIADWEWSGNLYVDEYYREVYTTFKKSGMVQIRKIDLETGKLTRNFDVPFPFPRKIEIYKGDAYFLTKDIGGELDKWKLVKLNL
ncbi:MAG: carboxypeptidase-like regulatory domain-containing protein [Bacteroidetes bacterium]|nr:carboxypeptidase-like regulatory domain-containing protein [Bacteroidota bacterium]